MSTQIQVERWPDGSLRRITSKEYRDMLDRYVLQFKATETMTDQPMSDKQPDGEPTCAPEAYLAGTPKQVVIYHSADYDGIFCREIAKKFLPDAELIGWNFGDAAIPFPKEGEVYVLDLPPDEPFGGIDALCVPLRIDRLTWIDHHASSIKKFDGPPSCSDWESYAGNALVALPPTNRQMATNQLIKGYRIDGVAACRLAWQWFLWRNDLQPRLIRELPMPTKEEFVNRQVLEPWAVRLAGEYDIWDKRDTDAELFQHGLRSRDLSSGDWKELLSYDQKRTIQEIEALIDVGHRDILRPDGTMRNPIVVGLLEAGKILQYAKTKENESIIKTAGFTFEFEGLKFLACNHARYNSFLFTAGLTPEHDACFGFAWRGGKWNVSLYHAPGKEHHDLSKIAVKYGGGGHRGACGFQMDKLPFLNS